MIKYYYAESGKTQEISEIANNCWINLIDPTEEEIFEIHQKTGIELDALNESLDEEERSRIQTEDDYTMIIVDTPVSEEKHGKQTYATIPIAIFITKSHILTICTEDVQVFNRFEDSRIKGFFTKMKTRFILQILYRNASLFLQYLRSIDKKSEIIEKRLHHSTQNKELIQLVELQKSLVYFSASLKGNDVVLEKLMKTESIKKYPEDEELLEDTMIENRQAIEMANIYSGILNGTMDAFASLISNNLNRVMKILAIVTIVLSIPTMIFSAYGMNLNSQALPFSQEPYSFIFIILFSVVIVSVVAFIFIKSKMFK